MNAYDSTYIIIVVIHSSVNGKKERENLVDLLYHQVIYGLHCREISAIMHPETDSGGNGMRFRQMMAQLNIGNPARLRQKIRTAQNGENITIAYTQNEE